MVTEPTCRNSVQHQRTISDVLGFAEIFILSPIQCILAGDPKTHKVCIPTIVMYSWAWLLEILLTLQRELKCKFQIIRTQYDMSRSNTEVSFNDCKTPSNERCWSCPGLSARFQHLKSVFIINWVTEVQFEKWLGTVHFTLWTQLLSSDYFVDSLCDASIFWNYMLMLQNHRRFTWSSLRILFVRVKSFFSVIWQKTSGLF